MTTATRMIVMLRDGEVVRRLPLQVRADGTLWGGDTQVTRREGGPVRLGDNGGGLVVVLAAEWDRAEGLRLDEVAAARERRLAQLLPGLAHLRAARDGEESDRARLARAMESETGSATYRPAYSGPRSADLLALYPTAAAYLRAESWSCAAHDAKVAAGRRAMGRIEAGGDAVAAIREMEEEWIIAAAAACDRS